MDYANPLKSLHRDLSVTEGKSYNQIIDLCGPQMLSIKHLIEGGYLDRRSCVTIIDRDKKNAKTIGNRWKSSGLLQAPKMHIGELYECPLNGSYDWVNLDTCSSFSFEMANWISRINFAKDGELNVWLTQYRANRAVLNSLHKTFSMFYDTPNKLIENGHDGEHTLLEFIEKEQRPDVLCTAAGIAQSLNRYEFRIKPVRSYIYHQNRMFLYRFTEIFPRSQPQPTLADILIRVDRDAIKFGDNKSSGLVGEFTKITDLILLSMKGGDTHRSYAVSRMRRKIKENEIVGKTPKMTKAGWKSYIAKIEPDVGVRQKCFGLIDRV